MKWVKTSEWVRGTVQKMKFSIEDFFSKCDQIRSKLRIWLHLLKKSFMETSFFVQRGLLIWLQEIFEWIWNRLSLSKILQNVEKFYDQYISTDGLTMGYTDYTWYNPLFTMHKKGFSIKDFFSKCEQIRSFPQIWSHLLKKSWLGNFIFCAVSVQIQWYTDQRKMYYIV